MVNIFKNIGRLFLFGVLLTACSVVAEDPPLFKLKKPLETGIQFINKVENKEGFNIFSYRNFYNGGGVAIGDINNDGFKDVFLTSNMAGNKLYLNKGNFEFEDISTSAGIEDTDKWSTGVVFVDINDDGFLDIYVCNAGYREGSNQKNSLFINQGDLTFLESAEEYGLADSGYSTHAAFFDYDRDGDLDVYMLNNSFIPVNTLNYNNKRDLRAKDWPVKDFLKGGGDKLYKNDNGKFYDVSQEAGIYGSLIGFGLGVTVADFNDDDWPDLYVCNDFFERDYYYLNNKNGTFSEVLEQHFGHISLSSMGADAGDINNDGKMDLFVTDMLPGDEYRRKTTATFENIDVYKLKQDRGFYHQFMQNSLQLNDGTGKFKEIAYYSGVAASDWSWGALIFDADLDAKADLLVCNGIYHDVIDQDFIDFFANDVIQKMTLSGEKEQIDNIISEMPSVPLRNHFFRNKGDLTFEDKAEEWGLIQTTFSNGAAYGDLDNDGDMDLVINNVNQEALVYENTNQEGKSYIQFDLIYQSPNAKAIGSKVSCFAEGHVQTQYLMPSRGFQSSVDYTLTFGLDKLNKIDSLVIIWPSGESTTLYEIGANQKWTINYSEVSLQESLTQKPSLPEEYFVEIKDWPLEQHLENDFTDFYFERNLTQGTSREGPCLTVGDVNGDGFEDFYLGGGAGQPGKLYFGTPDGIILSDQDAFAKDSDFEDTAAQFVDVDGDGDLDLYVGSGGNHHQLYSPMLQDRLYLNNGEGEYEKDVYALPRNGFNTSVVLAYDYDQDGDQDLFVGSRNIPFNYGISPPSFLLNNVNGKFRDVAAEMNPELSQPGLVTDAKWVDVARGRAKELVIVGEWMAPKIFSYNGKVFEEIEHSLKNEKGWWYHINTFDADGDGKEDLLLGNKGENFYLNPSHGKILKLWMADFSGDGTFSIVVTQRIDGKDKPIASKRDLTEQFPELKKQNLKHSDYALKSILDLFDNEVLAKAAVKEINTGSSILALNKGEGSFSVEPLPDFIQLSSVNSSEIMDVNADGRNDIIIGGNNFNYLPQFSRLDASRGEVLLNEGSGKFVVLNQMQSGLNINGVVRDMVKLHLNDKIYMIVGINNKIPRVFELKSNSEFQ